MTAPSTGPNRELILDRLAEDLASISVANGFFHDVQLVRRELYAWSAVELTKLPQVCISAADAIIVEHFSAYQKRKTMTVDVVGYTGFRHKGIPKTVDLDALRSRMISRMAADLEYAIESQEYFGRGGYAVSSKVIEVDTDEGHSADDSRERDYIVGLAYVKCQIVWIENCNSHNG